MSFQNSYSLVDRLLHRFAFATSGLQIELARADDERLVRAEGALAPARPVFITALPRAGTTLLLELLAETGAFASHTYRDMPFVLAPLFWSRFSAGFRKADAPRERAHADGMMVSADSPEAFEEMLWMAFWKDQYRPDRILPWAADAPHPEFLEFFRRHMVQIMVLRRGEGALPRYASKNNLNIARLGWLARALPDATLIVPFREPLEHAASLLRQHLNFLKLHAGDPFARAYMAGIGHFDFGANLRPVDFGDWLSGARHEPTSLGFWLAYWTAAYRACLAERERIHLLDYDALCQGPFAGLGGLADLVGLDRREAFLARAAGIRPPRAHAPEVTPDAFPLLEEARALHAELSAASVLPPPARARAGLSA